MGSRKHLYDACTPAKSTYRIRSHPSPKHGLELLFHAHRRFLVFRDLPGRTVRIQHVGWDPLLRHELIGCICRKSSLPAMQQILAWASLHQPSPAVPINSSFFRNRHLLYLLHAGVSWAQFCLGLLKAARSFINILNQDTEIRI